MSTYRDKMVTYAQEKGWLPRGDRDLSKLDASQYREAAVRARPMKQLAKDASAAVVSRGLTTIGLRVVPDSVAASNEAKCRSCPHGLFIVLRNGEPVCHECNCSDKWLKSKWRDRRQYCPKGEWDNRKAPEQVIVAGDAQGSR